MTRRQKPRRGIVILVVLSLLVLFVMMVVTFVIVSARYRLAAEATSRQKLFGVDAPKQLDSAMYQVLRDNTSLGSVIRFHSLLRDMYGEDGFLGQLAANTNVPNLQQLNTDPVNYTGASYLSGGQFIDLLIASTVRDYDGKNKTLSTQAGYYNGCVLTITSGKARLLSTRIVGCASTSAGYVLRVMRFASNDGSTIGFSDLDGASFVVNGRPFQGTGFGYQSATGRDDALVAVNKPDPANPTTNVIPIGSQPIALLPNHAFRPSTLPSTLCPTSTALVGGGTNEPYDAVDFQNMALAMNTPWMWSPGPDGEWGVKGVDDDGNGTVDDVSEAGASGSDDRRVVIPSFHRPDLINYWMEPTRIAYWNEDAFKRLVCLRPIEPNFDGSNPNFTYVYGPWDVDNDGDGLPDSIWVDLGLPVVTAADGRRYKPLFAILCVDLDGRLNVNAHGRLDLARHTRTATDVPGLSTPNLRTAGRVGQGYGPPEVRLDAVAGGSQLITNRYGSDGVPGLLNQSPVSGQLGLLARIRFFEEPSDYFNYLSPGTGKSSYFTLPDLHGELAQAIDCFGQPTSETVTSADDLRANSPYELNLVNPGAADQPYTAAELERVLRRGDLDASTLSGRLAAALNSTAETPYLVTTHSFDPAVPGTTQAGKTLLDILANRMDSGVALDKKMWASELLLGLRMDINRPLGNGRNDGVTADLPDEMYEQANESIWSDVGQQPSAAQTAFQNVPLNHTNGVDVNGDGVVDWRDAVLARQLYARHLYCLMLALIGGAPADWADEVAQWAINVVDFRDADSTMTPFEYNRNPFTAKGWGLDGDISTDENVTNGIDRGVVWGCERPELLIMETLAFHDRRTEDLGNDDGAGGDNPGKTTDPAPNNDSNFDQRLVPRGPFFIELFNPWRSESSAKSSELYSTASPVGVDLARIATDSVGNRSPVWRLAFVKRGEETKDPDDPIPANRPTLARRIYFVNPASVTTPTLNGAAGDYWTSLPVSPVQPGRYAVVGSAGLKIGTEYVSPVGRVTGITTADETDFTKLKIASTRRVVLSPQSATSQVHIVDNLPATALPPIGNVQGQPADNDIQPATAIVIDLPRSLSISEPIIGAADDYPTPIDQSTDPTACIEGEYKPPRDTPLDAGREGDALMKDQTVVWGVIHLQRLANPVMPYHPVTNPYRTIDYMRCDLTCFNGVTAAADPMWPHAAGEFRRFYATQRGDTATNRELWPPEPTTIAITADSERESLLTPNSNPHVFDFLLRSSLGHLSHGHWPYILATQDPTSGATYKGGPAVSGGQTHFSWFSWNNRPFGSAYELMLVPRCRSSLLLQNYQLPTGAAAFNTRNGDYRYPLNFFWAVPDSGVTPPYFFRLLDYVHVPSRFVGAETVLSPATETMAKPASFRNVLLPSPPFAPNTPNRIANPTVTNPSFLTPFNRVSEFRDPGKVNINTIFHEKVWLALKGGFAGGSGTSTFDALVASRRGYMRDKTSPLLPSRYLPAPDSRFPSYFSNPFRPSGNGSLVPLSYMERKDDKDIETTLLRSNAFPPDLTTNPPDPAQPGPCQLLLGGDSGAESTNPRNAAFRYEMLNRLGNMVTTRSNVYAIWITIGYFEMEPNLVGNTVVVDQFHPDGLRLAQEVGIDTGAVQRHRAFYIIDRSIPVAFQPGENHNVDRCILVRRYIE